ADLADDDRNILLERHVHDRAVSDIATGLGVRPHAVTMRLRRAEERLAGAFAAAHAHAVNEPECRTTRAAMHDYLKDRLLPRRRGRFEAHMDACAECTRAFVDVREVSWMLRDLGQHVVAGAIATGALGAAAGAVAAGGAAGAGGAAAGASAPRSFGKKEAAIVAGVLAMLAIGGGAAALVAGQADEPPAAESVADPGAGGGTEGGAGTGGSDGGGSSGNSGDGEGGDGGGGSRTDSDPGTDVADWLAQLGIGNGPSDGGAGGSSDTAPEGSDVEGSDVEGSDADGGNVDGSEARDEPGGGRASDGDTGGDGPASADGARPGVGAELTDWLAGLGAIGIPGFLLIVFLLWLWERWSRAEE
ncbi:zf-HC2 domain-containing protein, partial [Promicromonospora xylanilytica]